jgi:ribonuclease P protein component
MAFSVAWPRGAVRAWCKTGAGRAVSASLLSDTRPRVKRRLRLRRQADFRAAISGRRVYTGRSLVAFAVPGAAGESRVGVTVSRNIKGSVERNRARRRLREVARERLLGSDSPLSGVGIRYDVVLIARPAALEVPFAELKEDVERAALRLSKLKP